MNFIQRFYAKNNHLQNKIKTRELFRNPSTTTFFLSQCFIVFFPLLKSTSMHHPTKNLEIKVTTSTANREGHGRKKRQQVRTACHSSLFFPFYCYFMSTKKRRVFVWCTSGFYFSIRRSPCQPSMWATVRRLRRRALGFVILPES